MQGQTDRMKPDAKVRGKEENVSHTDEEDFDQHVELQEAVELLCRAVECLGALINKEIASMASSTANDGSENETKDREGDSNSLFKSEEDQGGDDVDDDEDGDVDEEGLSGIVETLAVQLAGVLHKLVQGTRAESVITLSLILMQ